MTRLATFAAVAAMATIGGSPGTAAQPIPAGMKVGLATYVGFAYDGLKGDLLAAAAAMPEADYGFKPAAAAEMRSYGQLFAHVAEGQFGTCATLKGVANPVAGRSLEKELRSKAGIEKALADSFALCNDAILSLTDATAADFVAVGKGHVAKGAVVTGLLAHGSEMYGIATVYLRAKGLVPPSTARQQPRPAPAR
jgi:hypothetical protein